MTELNLNNLQIPDKSMTYIIAKRLHFEKYEWSRMNLCKCLLLYVLCSHILEIQMRAFYSFFVFIPNSIGNYFFRKKS